MAADVMHIFGVGSKLVCALNHEYNYALQIYLGKYCGQSRPRVDTSILTSLEWVHSSLEIYSR